jgi:cell division control protein 45
MLLRHWNLYDSLCNSNYLVSKLELWKEHGQKELKRILATLGVSLEQAKQKFAFMDPLIKNDFKLKFMELA